MSTLSALTSVAFLSTRADDLPQTGLRKLVSNPTTMRRLAAHHNRGRAGFAALPSAHPARGCTNTSFGTASPVVSLRLACLICLQMLLLGTLFRAVADPVEAFRTGINLDFLGLRDGLIYWKSDCPLFPIVRLMQAPSGGGPDRQRYQSPFCIPRAQLRTEVALDERGHYYWVDGGGRLHRLREFADGTAGIADLAVTADPTRISVNGQVDTSADYAFWTEEHGFELTVQSKIFRALKDWGAAELVKDFTTRSGSYGVTEMHVHDDNLLTVLTDGQRLIQLGRVFISLPAPGYHTWLEETISTAAIASTVHGDRIYWVDRSSDSRDLFFRSAPASNPREVILHHRAFRATPHHARVLAVDGVNLYYQDLTEGNGPIVRKSLSGGEAEEISVPLGHVATHMVTDGRHVFWRNGDHTISRLPVNAAAITYDIELARMEIIQAVQNPDNEAPLVMGKATFVRFFSQFTSSESLAEIEFWPAAELRGSKDGLPLEGSPLRPERRRPFGTTPDDREDLNEGFLFRLPDAWTRQGEIVLRGVVNPQRVVDETSFANNAVEETVNFVPKAPVCMVFVPTRTHAGTITDFEPRFQEWFDYAEAMLPCSELHTFFIGGLLEDGIGGRRGAFELGSGRSDDSTKILWKLRRTKRRSDLHFCEADGINGYDHFCAVLPWPQPGSPDYSGKGLLGAARNRPSMLFFALPFLDGLGNPAIASTICQELGHNYGRKHINCGGPPLLFRDHSYPYDPCTLSSPEAGFIGFDPIRKSLILPDEASDFMTYGTPNWVSDYTWRKLFNRLGTMDEEAAAAAEAPLRAASAMSLEAGPGSISLVTGRYDPIEGTAELDYIYPLNGPQLMDAEADLAELEASPEFELRAFDAAGGLVGTFSLVLEGVPFDEGGHEEYGVMSLATLPETAVRLALVKRADSTPLAELRGGGSPPTVTITRPAANEMFGANAPFIVEWTANDPEGNPLGAIVRLSHDSGRSWRVLTDDYPESRLELDSSKLPGGENSCLVEVSVSDGLRTASAQTGPFTIAPKPPQTFIYYETLRGRVYDQPPHAGITPSETVIFHGKASDAEDGPLSGKQLAWSLSGPVQRNAVGPRFELTELSPGDYLVTLRAFDRNQNEARAQATLTVFPKFVENSTPAVLLDGFNDDAAYRNDHCPLVIRYPKGEIAEIRMIHHGTKLYVAVAGLPIGSSETESVALFIDVTGDGGQAPGVGDLRFQVRANGTVHSFQGNGSAWVEDPHPVGLQARVSRGKLTWTAELCIDESRLGGWNGQRVRSAVAHLDRERIADNVFWPASASGSPSSWAATVLGSALSSFQQGAAGFAGTQDTEIRFANPENAFGNQPYVLTVTAFGDPAGPVQGLLRFDIIGHGSGQVPLGSMIESATLTLSSTRQNSDSTAAIRLHRMLVPWDEASNWSSLSNGVSLDNMEALMTPDATFIPNFPNPGGSNTQVRVVDVTAAVRAWANGAANHGWVLAAAGGSDYFFDSSENAEIKNRPALMVQFMPITCSPPAPTPRLICPQEIVVECQGPDGTAVSFNPKPVNFCSANVSISCEPESGSAFPLGIARVTCTAIDDCGHQASGTFKVIVVDSKPPTVACSSNIVITSPNSSGALVHYNAPTATDNCDPNVAVVCTPPSGSVFPVGTTRVTCTATDAAGNTSTCSLEVKVEVPSTTALQILRDGREIKVVWSTPDMVLEEADDVTGPWRALPNATSPYVVTLGAHLKFYRLRSLPWANLKLANDRLALVAVEGAKPEHFGSITQAHQLQFIAELPDHTFLFGTAQPLDLGALATLTRHIVQQYPNLVQQAGLVATPDGAQFPLIITDELIVQFHQGVDRAAIADLNAMHETQEVFENPYWQNQFLLRLQDASADALEVSRLYLQSPLVEYAEPNFVRFVDYRDTIPDDPLFASQWHLHNTGQGGGTVDADIDAPKAWDLTAGSLGVVIADIDGGFDVTHPDLAPNLWVNPGEVAGNGIDDDGNGFVDDINGWDFTGNDNTLAGTPHGTATAGCAGARGNNMLGVTGSCPNCGLMLIRQGTTAISDVLAFDYARRKGADIITCSWGYGVGTPLPVSVVAAINRAAALGRRGLGCVIFFAMNNGNLNDCAGPTPDISSLPTVIAVSAASNQDRKVTESGFGNCMDVLGPTHRGYGGVPFTGTLNITTTDVTGGAGYNTAGPLTPCPGETANQNYTFCFRGTSAATPIVAGIAGLVLSLEPDIWWFNIQRLLQDTADKIEDSAGWYSTANGYSSPPGGIATHGYGRVNAFEAVRVVAPIAIGGRGGVDVFIRDNRLDWGNTEQPSNVLMEPTRGYIPHYESVDIKVDAPPFQPTPTTAAAFDALDDENPVAETVNRVYVRVRNRGLITAERVTVKLHWAFAGAALPRLPADFWSRFPADSADTSRWHPLGVRTIENLRYSGASAAGIAGDRAEIVSFDFPAPAIDPGAPAPRHHCLFALIDSPQDLVSAASRSSFVPDYITPRDNNVTHRNVQLQDPTGGGVRESQFYVRNPLDTSVVIALRIQAPPNWPITLSPIQLGEPFQLNPGDELLCEVKVGVLDPEQAGSLTIWQERIDVQPAEVMGGLTIRFDSPGR